MPKSVFVAFSALGLALAGTAVAVQSVEAGIACKDGFQLSGGNWISTPYCNDAHLAEIARQHGVKVSAAEVRANPARKYELCRFLEGTLSARDYCPDGGSGRH